MKKNNEKKIPVISDNAKFKKKSNLKLNYIVEKIKKLKYKIEKRDSFRPKRGTLSTNKAKRLLNYKPIYNLEKGIKKYLNFINFLNKNKK